MICEMSMRLTDSDFGDTTKNRKKGDVVSLITADKISAKFSELFIKGMLTQSVIDGCTDIKKAVDDVDLDDLQKAQLRWPWGDYEKKARLLVVMDLSADEIKDLSGPDGTMEFVDGHRVFIQIAYRKKNLNFFAITALLDPERIEDKDDEYQPIKDDTTDKSMINSVRDATITE